MSSTPAMPLLGVRVLLVEDDDDIRALFAMALEHAGAEVRAASGAKGAMRTVLQWLPTVVVSDLALPTTDGLPLLREIRLIPGRGDLPAIAVTGMGNMDARDAALAAGFQEHITKPVEPGALVAIVRRWASHALA